MLKKVSLFAILFLSFLIIPSIVEAAPLFTDGFETGNYTAWTGTSGTPTVTTSTVHTGTYSANLSVQAQKAYKSFTQPTNTYTRFYYRVNGYGSGNLEVAYIFRASWDAALSLWIQQTTHYFYISTQSGTTVSTTVCTLNTWFCLELKYTSNLANLGAILYVDGAIVVNATTPTYAANAFYINNYDSGFGTNPNALYDDVVIDSSYIGLLAPPDTAKPTYALVNASTVIPAQICIFSCNWTDETGLSGYIFGTNNTGTWTNETWITLTSWANVTKTLNATDTYIVQFEWWANDTSNNWNNTGIQSITLTAGGDVLPYLAMGGILGGTGVMAIFLIRKRRE